MWLIVRHKGFELYSSEEKGKTIYTLQEIYGSDQGNPVEVQLIGIDGRKTLFDFQAFCEKVVDIDIEQAHRVNIVEHEGFQLTSSEEEGKKVYTVRELYGSDQGNPGEVQLIGIDDKQTLQDFQAFCQKVADVDLYSV